MADVYIYTDSTGVITTDTSVIQTQVEDEYRAALGADLNVSPNTPQGVLIATEVLARTAVADNNAEIANQINPDISGGVYLQALMALLGSYTLTGAPSIVLATLTGVPGTVIPKGSQASETAAGAIFATTIDIVIPSGGTISNVEFQSLINGPVPCAAGNLTQIVNGVLGWETVNNPSAGTPGTLDLSDNQIRTLRKNTLAAQGMGFAQAISSDLYLTPGVTSLSFRENTASTSQTIDGVLMVPHSMYTCVAGTASSIDIATTITNSKNGGCAYNNGLGIQVQQDVVNAYSGQVIPVLFDRPSQVTVAVRVTVAALSSVQDMNETVSNAVVAYAAGELANMPGFVVGANVSPSQIAAGIAQQIPGIFIQSVEVGVQSYSQQATTTASSTAVTGLTYTTDLTSGMGVSGPGIPVNTTISGAPASNSLTLSNAATASGTSTLIFTKSPVLSNDTIEIQIWQQAATSDGYITVVIV